MTRCGFALHDTHDTETAVSVELIVAAEDLPEIDNPEGLPVLLYATPGEYLDDFDIEHIEAMSRTLPPRARASLRRQASWFLPRSCSPAVRVRVVPRARAPRSRRVATSRSSRGSPRREPEPPLDLEVAA